MGRSHAWLPRGTVLVEPRPMNWGDNLTLVAAIRVDRWLTLATAWGAMNTVRFGAWVRRYLVRHLRPGDVVIMDNLAAHKALQVRDRSNAPAPPSASCRRTPTTSTQSKPPGP